MKKQLSNILFFIFFMFNMPYSMAKNIFIDVQETIELDKKTVYYDVLDEGLIITNNDGMLKIKKTDYISNQKVFVIYEDGTQDTINFKLKVRENKIGKKARRFSNNKNNIYYKYSFRKNKKTSSIGTIQLIDNNYVKFERDLENKTNYFLYKYKDLFGFEHGEFSTSNGVSYEKGNKVFSKNPIGYLEFTTGDVNDNRINTYYYRKSFDHLNVILSNSQNQSYTIQKAYLSLHGRVQKTNFNNSFSMDSSNFKQINGYSNNLLLTFTKSFIDNISYTTNHREYNSSVYTGKSYPYEYDSNYFSISKRLYTNEYFNNKLFLIYNKDSQETESFQADHKSTFEFKGIRYVNDINYLNDARTKKSSLNFISNELSFNKDNINISTFNKFDLIDRRQVYQFNFTNNYSKEFSFGNSAIFNKGVNNNSKDYIGFFKYSPIEDISWTNSADYSILSNTQDFKYLTLSSGLQLSKTKDMFVFSTNINYDLLKDYQLNQNFGSWRGSLFISINTDKIVQQSALLFVKKYDPKIIFFEDIDNDNNYTEGVDNLVNPEFSLRKESNYYQLPVPKGTYDIELKNSDYEIERSRSIDIDSKSDIYVSLKRYYYYYPITKDINNAESMNIKYGSYKYEVSCGNESFLVDIKKGGILKVLQSKVNKGNCSVSLESIHNQDVFDNVSAAKIALSPESKLEYNIHLYNQFIINVNLPKGKTFPFRNKKYKDGDLIIIKQNEPLRLFENKNSKMKCFSNEGDMVSLTDGYFESKQINLRCD